MRPLMERALRLKLELQGADMSSPETSIDRVVAVVQSEHPDVAQHAAPDGTVTAITAAFRQRLLRFDTFAHIRFKHAERLLMTLQRHRQCAQQSFRGEMIKNDPLSHVDRDRAGCIRLWIEPEIQNQFFRTARYSTEIRISGRDT